jgi:SAM-dependent methyltransferase
VIVPASAATILATVEFSDFVLSQLARTPSRVLEVGCGEGRLALALAAVGHDVTAIDPVAPEGPIFQRVTLEEFDASERFDAVVASRSLHHVPDLDLALEKIAQLAPVLIVDEFAWDRLDERTATWYLAHLDGPSTSLEECRGEWADEHAGLHGYENLRTALDRRFRERFFAWRPHLHRLRKMRASEEDEQSAIDVGAINSLGFRYVGAARTQLAPDSAAR